MNLLRSITLLVTLAVLTGGRAADLPAKPAAVAPASTVRATTAGPVTGLAAFRIIEERNIFNPNRVGRTVAGDAPAPQPETIAFVGTMHYEKGLFAFFASATASFQKTLHEGGQIAQYTVGHITKDTVDLTRDGQKLTLNVGQALSRPPGGDWTVTTPVVITPAPASESVRPGDQSASTPPAVPADASETLKRLMEKRQQQLKP